jgi:hypothetical protein
MYNHFFVFLDGKNIKKIIPMRLVNSAIRAFFSLREERIKILLEQPLESQNKWLSYLLDNGSKTTYGKQFGMKNRWSYSKFSIQLPVQNYNSLMPYINRIMQGENNLLWNSRIDWVAKSSGTTQTKSKYIPITEEALKNNNYLAARDSLTFYCHLFPETEMFNGKGITLGGTIHELDGNCKVKCGDVSAILMNNIPVLGDFLKAPNREILLGSNWHEKLQKIAQNTVDENITSLSGVPSWMLLVLKEVLKISGKETINDVWPNLEVYFHGGVAFLPYINEYKEIMNNDRLFYMNMYNASEGFFGFQDQKNSDELLLLTDHGIFYEFISINETGVATDKIIPLSDVELNKVYELVITSLTGLWRYKLGDTIKFTSLNPYRFKITGRTTHFINVFGEELVVDNTDKAIKTACEATNAILNEYTVAPIYANVENSSGGHEWLIEFTQKPDNLENFIETLDRKLKELNSDYEAKRTDDLILKRPQIVIAPNGLFIKWLGEKNKLGGQYKVPRLQNDRKMIEELINMM